MTMRILGCLIALSLSACGDVEGTNYPSTPAPKPSPNAPIPVEHPKEVMYCTHLGVHPICCCEADYDALGRIQSLSDCERGLTILEPANIVLKKK